jgi:hypothetical protein
MIRGRGYEIRGAFRNLYRIKGYITKVIAFIVIASVLVLPGCSSRKINTDENFSVAENTADTNDQAKQNEGKSSDTEPNTSESKPSDAGQTVDEKPVADADLQSSEYIAASSLNLKQNTSDTDVLKEFGKAEEESEAIIWGSDGLEHQAWKYPSQGIELDMVKDSSQQGGQTVKSISISAPCSYKTNRNIGIGSTSDEVLAAYKAEIEEENISESEILAGSVYGGVVFHLENDRVSSIFIGAAAE